MPAISEDTRIKIAATTPLKQFYYGTKTGPTNYSSVIKWRYQISTALNSESILFAKFSMLLKKEIPWWNFWPQNNAKLKLTKLVTRFVTLNFSCFIFFSQGEIMTAIFFKKCSSSCVEYSVKILNHSDSRFFPGNEIIAERCKRRN